MVPALTVVGEHADRPRVFHKLSRPQNGRASTPSHHNIRPHVTHAAVHRDLFPVSGSSGVLLGKKGESGVEGVFNIRE